MSIEELSKLSDEELRVRCAEALGAENIHESAVIASFGDGCGDGLCGKFPGYDGYTAIPEYPADLNAMHEAEKTLGKEGAHHFHSALLNLVGDNAPSLTDCKNGKPWAERWSWHATARQRCIAFIAVKQQPVEVKGGGE